MTPIVKQKEKFNTLIPCNQRVKVAGMITPSTRIHRKEDMPMRTTITVHIGAFTVTIVIRKRGNRHPAR